MALKHKLSRPACWWHGHKPVHGFTMICGSTYECICCDRCRKVLVSDNHPASSPWAWSQTNMGRR